VSEYKQVFDGDWEPLHKTEVVACCDCGLVHVIRYRVRDGKPEVQYRRDNRRTGQLRRWREKGVKKKEKS
jgi:hypothetical protein